MPRFVPILASGLLLGLLAPPALATPAELLILVDTSASMDEPVDGATGETRLDVARRVAGRIAALAAERRHRVGLMRFRQLDAVVQSGEGPRAVHVEDEAQCRLASDLLVPLAANGAAPIERWTNGVDAADDPELRALGDSPLYAATQVAVRYIRGRRGANPLQSCVNAFIIVLTDGEDTCATGADLDNVLAELREQSSLEDIRGLVLSFHPDSEASELLAAFGHEAEDGARPWGWEEEEAFVAAVGAIQGRVAPEACVVSGVEPTVVGLPAGFVPGTPASGGGSGEGSGGSGCGAAGGGAGGLGWVAVLLVGLGLWARRRARRYLLAAALLLVGACGDGGAGGAADVVGGDGVGEVSEAPDPSGEAATALARLDRLVARASEVRTSWLAPLLEPDAVFAGLQGEAESACLGLARTLAYEPYALAQQGVRGCLATRRCNAMDQSLVLQACLASKGVAGTIFHCNPNSTMRPKLAAAGALAVQHPDVSAADMALRDAFDEALADEPELAAGIASAQDFMNEWADWQATHAVDADVAALRPLVTVTPQSSATWVRSRADAGQRDHYYVDVGGERLDPVLADGEVDEACANPAEADLDALAATVRMELLVQYADGSDKGLEFGEQVVASAVTWRPHERWGERATVAVVDAGTTALPAGVPGPADTGCLRAILRAGDETVVGEPFFLLGEEAADCPGTPVVEAAAGRHLARLTLRTTTVVEDQESTLDRVLIDRYGYASDAAGAWASGPQYSTEAARILIPMRVDLVVAAGVPGPHKLMDVMLADVVARRDELARALAARYGEPVAAGEAAEGWGPLRPMAWAVMGGVARYVGGYMPDGMYTLTERPWRMGQVRRRGYVEADGGLTIGPQLIFDIHEVPTLVVDEAFQDDPEAQEARLVANIAVGALVTEAERLATMGFDRTLDIIHAGEMLRDESTGPWALWNADEAHGQLKFSMSVRDAHRTRQLNEEELIVTPGTVGFKGTDLVAWWRVHTRSGNVLGEIRYDGTFYGGTAALQAIASFDACLFASAILALNDGSRVPDAACCFENAARGFVKDVVTSAVTGRIFSHISTVGSEGVQFFSGGAIYDGPAIAKLLKQITDTTSVVAFTAQISQPEICLQ